MKKGIKVLIIVSLIIIFIIIMFYYYLNCMFSYAPGEWKVNCRNPFFHLKTLSYLSKSNEAKQFCNEIEISTPGLLPSCVNGDNCIKAIKYGKSFCDGMDYSGNFDECYFYLGGFYADPFYCDGMSYIADTEDFKSISSIKCSRGCFELIYEKAIDDLSICDQLEDQDFSELNTWGTKANCYTHVARNS